MQLLVQSISSFARIKNELVKLGAKVCKKS